MYIEGNIIYFDSFYFSDTTSKPKYFLVLKKLGDEALIVSLPSSQAHIPEGMKGRHGCINLPDSGISCYVFRADCVICDNGFSFSKETYLHGHWLDEYSIYELNEKYSIEGIDYKIIGKLSSEEHQNIIECFKTSPVVKNKYRRRL